MLNFLLFMGTVLLGVFYLCFSVKIGFIQEVVGQRDAFGRYADRNGHSADLVNVPEVTKKYQRVFFSHRIFETLLSDQEHDSLERARTGGGLGLKYLGILESTLTDGVVTSVALLPWED